MCGKPNAINHQDFDKRRSSDTWDGKPNQHEPTQSPCIIGDHQCGQIWHDGGQFYIIPLLGAYSIPCYGKDSSGRLVYGLGGCNIHCKVILLLWWFLAKNLTLSGLCGKSTYSMESIYPEIGSFWDNHGNIVEVIVLNAPIAEVTLDVNKGIYMLRYHVFFRVFHWMCLLISPKI